MNAHFDVNSVGLYCFINLHGVPHPLTVVPIGHISQIEGIFFRSAALFFPVQYVPVTNQFSKGWTFGLFGL